MGSASSDANRRRRRPQRPDRRKLAWPLRLARLIVPPLATAIIVLALTVHICDSITAKVRLVPQVLAVVLHAQAEPIPRTVVIDIVTIVAFGIVLIWEGPKLRHALRQRLRNFARVTRFISRKLIKRLLG